MANSSFAFQNPLEFFKRIFLIYGWLNTSMWNPKIWRADCALIWTALGFNMDCFQTRFWIQLIRSGETWTVGVFSVTKSSQRSRRKGGFWRTVSLSNRAKRGVSFLPKAHLAPGLSSGRTLVWVPESLLLALRSFARYPLGRHSTQSHPTRLSRWGPPWRAPLVRSGPSVFWACQRPRSPARGTGFCDKGVGVPEGQDGS